MKKNLFLIIILAFLICPKSSSYWCFRNGYFLSEKSLKKHEEKLANDSAQLKLGAKKEFDVLRNEIDEKFSSANAQLLLVGASQVDSRKRALINKYTTLSLKLMVARSLRYEFERLNAIQEARKFGVSDTSGGAFGHFWKYGAFASSGASLLEKEKERCYKKLQRMKKNKTSDERAEIDRNQLTIFQVMDRVWRVCLRAKNLYYSS